MVLDAARLASLVPAAVTELPGDAPTTKVGWRAWADQSLRTQTAAQRKAHAAALTQSVGAWIRSFGAGLVGLYAPLGTETDPRDLANFLTIHGIGLAYPRLTPDGSSMDFVRCVGPSALQARPRSRLMEPVGPAIAPSELDVLLIPALGVHPQGARLGRGGGHFDRYLPKLRSDAVTIAVCPNAHVVAWQPTEAHDWPLRAVATETGLFRLG